jgi:hypothetical protein
MRQRKELRDKVRQNFDDINFTELCLGFYSQDGNYRDGINPAIMNQAKEAISAGKKSDDLVGDLRCLVRGFMMPPRCSEWVM